MATFVTQNLILTILKSIGHIHIELVTRSPGNPGSRFHILLSYDIAENQKLKRKISALEEGVDELTRQFGLMQLNSGNISPVTTNASLSLVFLLSTTRPSLIIFFRAVVDEQTRQIELLKLEVDNKVDR